MPGAPVLDRAPGGPYAYVTLVTNADYLPGATGWDAPVNLQFPVCWAPPVVSTASSPRFTSGAFAFTLVGNANLPVRIEACDSLASPSWSTVTDTILDASGTLDFSDPDASSHSSRFYRVTFPK